jgi:hypothetical protein
MIWLGFSVLGLLFVAAALVWTGWWAKPGTVDAGILPQKLIPLLSLPVAVAVTGYGIAIWRAWRRQPAVDIWLVGVGGHLTYLLLGAAFVGGLSLSEAVTWDNLWILLRLAVPGILLLDIERTRIENPLRP